jgi:hypothetical protein
MAPSTRSEAVLELGKHLVQQLQLDESVDTLSRWLAHTLAEKITEIGQAPPDQKPTLQSEVIELILKLWAHRRDFPRGMRPFEELEDLARVLRQLDPEDKGPRYFSAATSQDTEAAAPEAKAWLQRALAIDNAARATIGYCLVAADGATPGDATQWADLAEAAGLDRDIEIKIVNFVSRLSEEQRKGLDDHLASPQQYVKERVGRLKEAAAAIEAHIGRKLRAARKRG